MRYFVAFIMVSVAALVIWLNTTPGIKTSQRYPYEHFFRVTATLEFDGEQLPLDNLFFCGSDYDGPATRAVQLRFNLHGAQVALETTQGGVVSIYMTDSLCGAFAEFWAGIDTGFSVPEAWLPVISWYNHRDREKITYGETYWSETALKNPNGRLKIIESFRVSYPEQETFAQWGALRQAFQRQTEEARIWQPEDGSPARLFRPPIMKTLPMYVRVPRSRWSKPPDYERPKPVVSDWAALRDFLDALPHGQGLMFLGEQIEADLPPAGRSAIFDLKTGHIGDVFIVQGHGIPQRNEVRWAMLLNERSWQSAQVNKERISFFDTSIPLDYQNGVLVLRPDTPGMGYLMKGYGVWYRETAREVDFLGKPFVNGAYDLHKSLYIFDLKTRDLWMNWSPGL